MSTCARGGHSLWSPPRSLDGNARPAGSAAPWSPPSPDPEGLLLRLRSRWCLVLAGPAGPGFRGADAA